MNGVFLGGFVKLRFTCMALISLSLISCSGSTGNTGGALTTIVDEKVVRVIQPEQQPKQQAVLPEVEPQRIVTPLYPCFLEENTETWRGKDNCIQKTFDSVGLLAEVANVDRRDRLFLIDSTEESSEHGRNLRNVVDYLSGRTNRSTLYAYLPIDFNKTVSSIASDIRSSYLKIKTTRGENAILSSSLSPTFHLDGVRGEDLFEGPYILTSAGNTNRDEGPASVSNRDVGRMQEAVASGKVRWVTSIDDSGNPVNTGCTGVEAYCFSAPDVVTILTRNSQGETETVVSAAGSSVSTAFAFAIFSQIWERMPENTVVKDVFDIADSCTDARLDSTTPTSRLGLGILRVGCMAEKAREAWGSEDPLFEVTLSQALLGESLGYVSLPGLSNLNVQADIGGLVSGYDPSFRVPSVYLSSNPLDVLRLPVYKGLAFSVGADDEFGFSLDLPFSSNVSFNHRKTNSFFGGAGTKAFAFGETENYRIDFNMEVFSNITVGAWRVFAHADGQGSLLNSVKGEEEGYSVRNDIELAPSSTLSFYGWTSRFSGGEATLSTGESFRIDPSSFQYELGVSLSHWF